MNTRLQLACLVVTAFVCDTAARDDLGFEGHELVEPDCDAMSSWFQCRDIETAPPGAVLGYLDMHHTSATLGPDGNTVYPGTGEPYQPVAKVVPRATAPLTPCASFPDLDESTDSPAIRRLAHDAIDTIAHESTSATGCYVTTVLA